ncbi:MAG: helix-turn-helix domain-containing protein [Rhodospirillales bacterium]|nr:helix-turn-helix domain-containing protein [Rhodospirillales bacterium]
MTVQTPVRRSRPHPIDVHVGSRLRFRRLAVGLSQERLAKSIGITFQQIQKYERGTNRIVASRLHDLARVLDVPVNYFFSDMNEGELPESTPSAREEAISLSHGLMEERETLELVRAYYHIGDQRVRRRLFDLVKSVSKSSPSSH